MAVPSIFIVAPKGTVNDATFLFTPILSITVFKVTGIVAFDEEVEKANIINDFTLSKKLNGLILANKIKSAE